MHCRVVYEAEVGSPEAGGEAAVIQQVSKVVRQDYHQFLSRLHGVQNNIGFQKRKNAQFKEVNDFLVVRVGGVMVVCVGGVLIMCVGGVSLCVCVRCVDIWTCCSCTTS